MAMGWLVEGTQLSKLIAGLLETNGTALPPRDRVWPVSCPLGSQVLDRADERNGIMVPMLAGGEAGHTDITRYSGCVPGLCRYLCRMLCRNYFMEPSQNPLWSTDDPFL